MVNEKTLKNIERQLLKLNRWIANTEDSLNTVKKIKDSLLDTVRKKIVEES